MKSILINIDVPDLDRAIKFYTSVFDLSIGRKFGSSGVELVGGSSNIYLLKKDEGTKATPKNHSRIYDRHWCPVHLDFVVDDIQSTTEALLKAGAIVESPIKENNWGKIAIFSDPFGHGVCVIEFVGRGYDEIADA